MLVGKVIATVLAFAAAIGILLGLPTVLVAWVGLLVAGWLGRFSTVSGWLLVGTLGVSVAMELVDNLLAIVMVRFFGASKGSLWLAWLGGLGGGILGGLIGGLGGFIGSAIGALGGAFTGGYLAVYAWERRQNRSVRESARAALGTVIGRLLGILLKLGWVGVLMVLIWRA